MNPGHDIFADAPKRPRLVTVENLPLATDSPESDPSDTAPASPEVSPRAPSRRSLTRSEWHRGATVDGTQVPDRLSVRLRRLGQHLLTSERERDEAELDQRLGQRRWVTRTNLCACVSPKGGVGKTTCSFLIANLLASRPKLRTLVIDTNPDFGTLGKLPADSHSSRYDLTDVIVGMNRIRSASELDPFVSSTPAGMHLLAAPADPEVMAEMTTEIYGRLLAFLGRFYHVILLDLGTGVTAPLARFALERADQAVVITEPDWLTTSIVLDALDRVMLRVDGNEVTMVTNKTTSDDSEVGCVSLQRRLREHGITRHVTIPASRQLREMLNQGTYVCERLDRPTRVAVKRLGLAVAERLV